MKIAICLSGHLRCFEKTFDSFEKFILSKYDCDIFIHTWNKLGYQSRFRSDILNDETNSKIELINNLYKPKQLIIESIDFIEELKKRSYQYAPYLINEPKPPHHMASMFYKIFACNEIRKNFQNENLINYDWVIRSRSDLLFHSEIKIPEHDLENMVFIPKSTFHPQWYNDQFCLATPNSMDVYSSSFFDIPEYFSIKEEYFPEKFMMWTLNKKGYFATNLPINFNILR